MNDVGHVSDADLELFEAISAAKTYMDEHPREFVGKEDWYDWQLEQFAAMESQTMTLAGNRTGKTYGAGYHTAVDLTCDYPDWWEGFKFTHGPNVLVGGVDNQQLKDVVQKELFGDVIEIQGKKRLSGGWVHPNEIGRIEWNRTSTDLASKVEVISKYGSSMCQLRAYSATKTGSKTLSFAGTSRDLIWIDECPPDELVGQLVARTMTGNMGRGGRIRYTMTPELGTTKLVTDFMENRQEGQRLIGPVAWSQCKHLTPEVQKLILTGIPEHEHDMRSKGTPFFGQGLVFTIPDERIITDSMTEQGKPITAIPWLKFIRAMDIGIDHPTAIAWLAYDPEIDRIYLLRTHSQSGDIPAVHAAVANSYLDFAPVVFPRDVDQTEKGSGRTVRDYYAEAGLKNTLDFKNDDGSVYIEPGIMELQDRMKTDRFKVFDGQCEDFFREKRLYHREKGKVVPINDDVISAVRYGAVMIPRYGVRMADTRRSRRIRVKKSVN